MPCYKTTASTCELAVLPNPVTIRTQNKHPEVNQSEVIHLLGM